MKRILISSALAIMLIPIAICAMDDAFDDAFIDQLSDTIVADMDTTVRAPEASIFTPTEVLNFLALFFVNELIFINPYCKTYTPQSRNVLDIPIIAPFCPHDSRIRFNFFYNQTHNVFLTPTCGGYLNLKEYIPVLSKVLAQIPIPLNINFARIIESANQIFVEERRAGGLLQWWQRTGSWIFGAQMPLFYSERNFNLPFDTQEVLKQDFDPNESSKNQEQFYRKHVIFDQIGIGDLRLTLAQHPLETDMARFCWGMDCTIPTDTAFSIGLLGSNLATSYTPITPDYTKLIELAIIFNDIPAITAFAKKFAINAGDQLGAILLNNSLGYERQWSLGLFAQPEFTIAQGFNLVIRGRAATILGRNVQRFFTQIKNPADFSAAAMGQPPFPPLTPEQAQAELTLLEVQTMYNFFPFKTKAHLNSRFMGEVTVMPVWEFTDNWTLITGYDFWYLSADKLTSVSRTCLQSTYPLDIAAAQRPRAIQDKIFFSIQYTSYRPHHDIIFNLGGDGSFYSSGIGKDISVVLGFAITY